MRFIQLILDSKGLSVPQLARLLNVDPNAVKKMLGTLKNARKTTGMQLKTLSKARKISGLSWSKFGEMIDEENNVD